MSEAGAILSPDPARTARRAGLAYISDEEVEGVTRRRRGKGFSYHSPGGALIGGSERERIKSLAIPPAWDEVWISPDPDAHILATGRDEAGRKQFIYHPRWREVRDRQKYSRMLDFAHLLPRIRQQVDSHLRAGDLRWTRVAAAAVYLMDRTGIRVGNLEYVEQNQSYGLTTLLPEHVTLAGSTMDLCFPGKSGRQQEIQLRDERIVRAISRCLDLEGDQVLMFEEEDQIRRLDAEDINRYLEEISGAHVTAKDFRLWTGTVRAILYLDEPDSEVDRENSRIEPVNRLLDSVAEYLGNTRAICREHYVHPELIECCEQEWPPRITQKGGRLKRELREWLSPAEQRLVRFLQSVDNS